MRILTVRQPWAYAIVHLGKDVENRVRNIAGDYRGPVAIHAALAEDSDFALNGRYAAVSEAMEEFAIEYERTRPRLVKGEQYPVVKAFSIEALHDDEAVAAAVALRDAAQAARTGVEQLQLPEVDDDAQD